METLVVVKLTTMAYLLVMCPLESFVGNTQLHNAQCAAARSESRAQCGTYNSMTGSLLIDLAMGSAALWCGGPCPTLSREVVQQTWGAPPSVKAWLRAKS